MALKSIDFGGDCEVGFFTISMIKPPNAGGSRALQVRTYEHS